MDGSVDWRKGEHQQSCSAGIDEALLFMRNLPVDHGLEEEYFVSLMGLLQTARHACMHLRAGWENCDIPLLAWSSRNAFEIMIWTKFVTLAPTNAKRFFFDWLNDADENLKKAVELDRVTGMDKATDGSYRDLFKYDSSDAAKHRREHLDKLRKERGYAPEKRLDIAKVADHVGEGDRFKSLNPFISKYLHVTAYSVLSIPSELGRNRTAAIMLDAGYWSLLFTIGTINDFLVARGLGAFLDPARGK